jgi:putative tricarboxylic transport membrane protein
MTIALLLPITYNLEPTGAIILLAGIFYGGMYGGSTTSILLNTPGESSSVVTAIEGNLMAKGAGPSKHWPPPPGFVGGRHDRHSASRLLLPDRHSVRDLPRCSGVFRRHAARLHRGNGGTRRFTAARLHLAGARTHHRSCRTGLRQWPGPAHLRHPPTRRRNDIVVIAVDIFALGEALWVAAHLRRKAVEVISVGRPWMGKSDFKRSSKPWLRGTALGFPFGAIPAGGAEIPTSRRSCGWAACAAPPWPDAAT